MIKLINYHHVSNAILSSPFLCPPKVGCKALVMADTHKTQDYYQMVNKIAHELPQSKPGELYSDR